MSFDLEKLQAVAELGEVIRLQNEALDRLVAFRKARPYLMMPNLAKMVEENIKENVQVLYKELNNLHKPAAQQVRYICKECQMAFLVNLPGGICDECRARLGSKPRDYSVPDLAEDDVEIVDEVSVLEESEPSVLETSIADNAKNETAEFAEAVMHDLSVAEPVEVPVQSSLLDDGNELADEPAKDDENVYELSMDDDTDLSSTFDTDLNPKKDD